jgi:glutamate 5-kinase
MGANRGSNESRRPSSSRRIVVKIGSAVIASDGTLDARVVGRIAADAGAVLEADPRRRMVIVSSGAVASGYRELGRDKGGGPPKDIVSKQAAAAVGQPRLMSAWAEAFGKRPVAQVLLTAEDIDHRTRFLNARRTLDCLLESGVVPIINENDSVSYSEIKLGDNDHLSSLVASLVDADLLVILSSVGGVWGAGGENGTKHVVPEIRSLAEGLKLVRSERSAVGTGGMETKIRAACNAASLGIEVVIASGAEKNVLERIVGGEAIGTRFPAASAPSAKAARKRWIGFSARPKGVLGVDEGAKNAIVGRGASLLPSGLSEVRGNFDAGALVDLAGPDGEVFARGLASYSSQELKHIRGKKTSEIAKELGYCYCEEVVHRDDLAVIESASSRTVRSGS